LQVQIQPKGSRAMKFKPTVTAATAGHELAWFGSVGVRGVFDGAHSFVLEPVGERGTSVTQSETFSGALVGLFRSGLEKTANGFDEMNWALKERCESAV